MEIKTAININASAEKVWNALTDFSDYPKRNLFIKSITGEPKVGTRITVEFKEMTFKPKVLVFRKNKEFRWLGKLWFKGLFDGEHIFKIEDHKDGGVTLKQQEKFSGILVPLFKKKLLTETKANFKSLNQSLKQIAEKQE